MKQILKISETVKKLTYAILLMSIIILTSTTIKADAQAVATNGADRIKVIAQHQALEAASSLNKTSFRSIGPSIMSGRVVDVDVNPTDPTEFYVAYATGGLWYTKNNGQSFTPVMDSLDLLFIGDIAVNWKTANRIIWVGTGEVNSSRSSYAGMGIFKSINNGQSWQYLGLPESHHIGKIELDPADPNTAWVAVLGHLYSPNKERGIYKTTDGGQSWKQTLFIDENTGAVDLSLNPMNPKELYAAVWYRTRRAWKFEESGKTSGIYKSIDGGDSWKFISGEGSGFMSGNKIGRIGLCVFPGNGSIVYAVVDNNTIVKQKEEKPDSLYKKDDFKTLTREQFAALDDKKLDKFLEIHNGSNAKSVKEKVAAGLLAPTVLWDYLDSDDGFTNAGIAGCEVYRSDDSGAHWKKTNEKSLSLFSTYGYYFAKIYTSYTDADKVYILGFNIQLSTDGGKSFKGIEKNNVHADHHALWVNPARDSHIIDGNDGGLNISYDNGENWFKANTPAVGQFYSVTTDDAKPYNVYGGLQDNGCWWGPSTTKENNAWLENGQYPYKSINGGDGMQVQVDKRDNSTIYSGSQFGVYGRYVKDKRWAQRNIRPQHELGEKPLRFNWETPILLSSHNQDVLYYGSNRFYRSLNKGDSLVAMGPDLTNGKVSGNVPYGTLTAIEESPLRFGLLYAGSDDGNIHLSTDGGYNWEKLNRAPASAAGKKQTEISTALNTNNLWVSSLTASAHQVGRVYVSLNGYRFDNFTPYLYVSEDYGHSWQSISSNLPTEPINVIKEDPNNPNILYVGTDGGLYVSLDRGQHFMSWNAGLPRSVSVHDIAIQKRENEIVIATHGRSLYAAKINFNGK